MIPDGLCLDAGYNRRERRCVGLFDGLQAAEVFEEAASGALAHAGNLQEFRGAVTHLAALAVESHGEAVSFVADELDQVQHRRVMIERDRILLLPVDVRISSRLAIAASG